ncbi:MAG: hypothetical protein ACRD2H_15080 [Terriglobales bacterium]
MRRRTFLRGAAAVPIATRASSWARGLDPTNPSPTGRIPRGAYRPGRIVNEQILWLPGEREALARAPGLRAIGDDAVTLAEGRRLALGESSDGWQLVAVLRWLNGIATAVFEKHAAHRGVIAYVTAAGEIARIPKYIGELARIRPRPTDTPHVRLERPAHYQPGPDLASDYILGSDEDPCFENVAALGAELVGWTLVANEQAGPLGSLWLEADGLSRQFGRDPQSLWAPDLTGRLFDPARFLPSEYLYDYVPGYSKRTLLGGYLPAADIGVWNPRYQAGYEVMMVLPPGADARPIARIRVQLPASAPPVIPAGDSGAAGMDKPARKFVERYWNGDAAAFFTTLVGIWNRWQEFFASGMQAEIPDEWLNNAARAGIVLARCSYRGLEPTYQIGEGAYTKIPERSHALFPVAHYEFVWAQQVWNLTAAADPYFEHYLQKYVLSNGDFLYNTQDQVEAPLDIGVFLENSARAYDYTRDRAALDRRLPILRRMVAQLLARYEDSTRRFPADDPRHGLIWGSPEADNGDPNDDFPESHPYYFQNAAWAWRGLAEHARCLARAGREHGDAALAAEGERVAAVAAELRADLERSLERTLAARGIAMKQAGITPFTPDDLHRAPSELSSYENHRYMMDWWTADWGDPALDEGHFRHRLLAGQQMLGMNLDGLYPRTSNFMEHGTLAGRIRQDDYRPFLMALYGNLCYAMDTGSRYAPEDALLPGNYPGEGSPYAWSAVVNSTLQPALGLRWLLCYEEHDRHGQPGRVHLQKAAPKHWFAAGEVIAVRNCPTRRGPISWRTEAIAAPGGRPHWRVALDFAVPASATIVLHLHPPDGQPLRHASAGELRADRVIIAPAVFAGLARLEIEIE